MIRRYLELEQYMSKSLLVYTGWLVTGGTSGKGVILREKRSRKCRIKIFPLRLCFRENRLWIFARYACTLSRLVITDLTVDRCLDGYYRSLSLFFRNGKLGIHNEIIWSNHKVYYYKNYWKCCPFRRTHTSALLIKFLWILSKSIFSKTKPQTKNFYSIFSTSFFA